MTKSIPWKSNHFNYSGIVGSDSIDEPNRAIILVHGNSRDATDWDQHFEYFSDRDISGDEIWAISFDHSKYTHYYLAQQLENFVGTVLDLTELDEISIISHSLGVTVSRYWMYTFERYDTVDTFIGIAGANHGSSLCPPKSVSRFFSDSSKYKPCESLTNNSITPTFIDRLNDKAGETPEDVNYYTIRGSKDKFFINCIDSPKLEGAEENILLYEDHEGARESKDSLEHQYNWIVQDS